MKLTAHIDDTGTLKMAHRDVLIDWIKQHPEYPHIFVSRCGRVYNKNIGRVMATQTTNAGYELINISYNGIRRAYTVHRLVAQMFIPNSENKEQVNHKDGNKLNNDASNLEWCTQSENMKHVFSTGRGEVAREKARQRMGVIGNRFAAKNVKNLLESNKRLSKAVLQIDTNGRVVKEFSSIKQAQRETKSHNINKVIKGEQMRSGGYYWKLKQDI